MTKSGRTNPVVTAILGSGEDVPPLRMRTATIVEVNKTVTPWTCIVRVSDVDIPNVTMVGWYDPRPGDIVKILQQGPELFIIGSFAPGKVFMPVEPPPAPEAPLPITPSPSVRRNVPVTAQDSAGWQFSFSTWRNDRFIQGGVGMGRYRPHWFYGNAIQAARGSGRIVAASIFVKRHPDGGVYGGARVLLGVHNLGNRNASGDAPLLAVAEVGTLNKGQGDTFALTQAQLDLLNNGSLGLGLEAREASYSSPDYMPSHGRQEGDWSGSLTLTIEG